LRLDYLSDSEPETVVQLPWGLPIKINPQEAIGRAIASQGLYEIGVTETLWRLTEPADLAIDAGANIGYTASILGCRVGPKGRVICFEPHPDVFASLHENVEMWKKYKSCGSFVLYQAALGAEDGHVSLHTNAEFLTNRGTAWISDNADTPPDRQTVSVPIQSLDRLIGKDETIGVLKMDVQGSELGVLQGMTKLLSRQGVRDIVFEEEHGFPAPTHEYLKSHGYTVFGLQASFTRVHCVPEAQPFFDPVVGPPPNYLATLNPERAVTKLAATLWRSFGPARFFGLKALAFHHNNTH
jgi:FkbM family methyltransferase